MVVKMRVIPHTTCPKSRLNQLNPSYLTNIFFWNLLQMRRHIREDPKLKSALDQMDFGRFLFLYLLAQNVDYFTFKSILDKVFIIN